MLDEIFKMCVYFYWCLSMAPTSSYDLLIASSRGLSSSLPCLKTALFSQGLTQGTPLLGVSLGVTLYECTLAHLQYKTVCYWGDWVKACTLLFYILVIYLNQWKSPTLLGNVLILKALRKRTKAGFFDRMTFSTRISLQQLELTLYVTNCLILSHSASRIQFNHSSAFVC